MAAMVFFLLFNFLLIGSGQAEQCGSQAGGALCAANLCCSQYGWCGSTAAYCDTAQNCQSQCSSSTTTSSASGVASIISSSVFDDFFPSRNSFYTYDSFLAAANSFGEFGTSGSSDDQKRELAAFFANVQQETGGLQEIEETNDRSAHCDSRYSCPDGKSYYGRGPLQLSWNYNYQAAGDYLQLDLINNPDLLAQDATASFKASVWFWMQSPSSSSSCHQAMIGGQGFGQTIKIINYSYECGKGTETAQASNRISYYESFCSKLGVDPGSNLTCA